MTPQQRLQEAKDQAAEYCHKANYQDWMKALMLQKIGSAWVTTFVNKVAALMYETGKKEGYEQGIKENISATFDAFSKQTSECETYRKALEEIAEDEYPAYDAEALSAELWSLKSIAHKALNNETQDS